MNKLTDPRLKEANSFSRPGEILGEWINHKVAEEIIKYLTSDRRTPDEGRMDQEEATATFESTLMRHAYDSIDRQIEVAPHELQVLNDLAQRIALKAANAVRPMAMVYRRQQKAARRPLAVNLPAVRRAKGAAR